MMLWSYWEVLASGRTQQKVLVLLQKVLELKDPSGRIPPEGSDLLTGWRLNSAPLRGLPCHRVGDWALERVARRGLGFPSMDHLQKPPGHGPRWPCSRRWPAQVPSNPNHSASLRFSGVSGDVQGRCSILQSPVTHYLRSGVLIAPMVYQAMK